MEDGVYFEYLVEVCGYGYLFSELWVLCKESLVIKVIDFENSSVGFSSCGL